MTAEVKGASCIAHSVTFNCALAAPLRESRSKPRFGGHRERHSSRGVPPSNASRKGIFTPSRRDAERNQDRGMTFSRRLRPLGASALGVSPHRCAPPAPATISREPRLPLPLACLPSCSRGVARRRGPNHQTGQSVGETPPLNSVPGTRPCPKPPSVSSAPRNPLNSRAQRAH